MIQILFRSLSAILGNGAMGGNVSFSLGRLLPRFSHLLLALLLFQLLSVQLHHFCDDPGVGWHLATGQWISQHFVVPRIDPHLHSALPRAWVADQWLSDLILYLTYELGGWPGLYWLVTTVFVLAFLGLGFVRTARGSGLILTTACVALLLTKIAEVHFILRPVVFGFLCFAAVYQLCLTAFVERRNFTRREIYLIAGLFVLWPNLHGSFVLGILLLLFLCLFGGAFPQRWKLLICAVLLTLCNPYGWELHKSIIQLGNSSYFMALHQEWLPVDFRHIEGHIFEALLLGSLSIALLGVTLRISLFEVATLITFIHLSLNSVRFLPFFSIIALPILVRLIEQLIGKLEQFEIGGRLVNSWWRLEEFERSGVIFPTRLVLAVLLGAIIWMNNMPFYSGKLGIDSAKFPVKAVEFLIRYRGGAQTVVAADPAWGGAITWHGQGKVKALIDDRNTLLGEFEYKQFDTEFNILGDWERYSRARGAQFIIVPSQSKFARALRAFKKRRPLYEDGTAAIYRVRNR